MNSDRTQRKMLDVRDLSVDVIDQRGNRQTIIQDVSFEIESGKVLALIGESGSGKTTASLALMGYAKAGCRISRGEVILDGNNVLALNDQQRRLMRGVDMSYIAQSAAAAFNGAIKIGQQVTEIPIIKKLMSRKEAEARAVELYRDLDLPEPERIGQLYPHQVSGGQLQRLMAAMAMICQPKLLILDEPTTALDVTTQVEVLEAFRSLIRRRGIAAIYVSHDLSVVAQIADEVLVLKDGKMVERGTTENIISSPSHEYTRTLMAAVKRIPKSLPHVNEVEMAREPLLLEGVGLTAAYGGKSGKIVLENVSISLRCGDALGVIGESGSGKSTLARVLAGLMPPVTGEVRLNGRRLSNTIGRRSNEEARRIQLVFQMADTALNPRQLVRDILLRPLWLFRDMKGKVALERVDELLEQVGLSPALAERFPYQLSGGQKQRLSLARALAAEPDVIICDEITASLDTVVAANIMELLLRLRSELGVAFIFISHDLSTVANFADRIAVMRSGSVAEQGPTSVVLSPPHHPYTELLLSSVPDLRVGWLDEAIRRRQKSSTFKLAERT